MEMSSETHKKYCSHGSVKLHEGTAVSREQGSYEQVSFPNLNNVQNVRRGAFGSFKKLLW